MTESSTDFVTAMSIVGVTGLTVAEALSLFGSRSGWSVRVRVALFVNGRPGVHRRGDRERRGLTDGRVCGMAQAPVAAS